ncbi:MAG: hypothetical protein L6V93_11805 [Clostridiales bacterium]|nr:MAG: hypothetical protein L6V93_11805 [Clostridiales bacterium]
MLERYDFSPDENISFNDLSARISTITFGLTLSSMVKLINPSFCVTSEILKVWQK